MFAYTELVHDDAPISMSAIVVFETLSYDMCSITFKDSSGVEIETWDNDQFIAAFCEMLKGNEWSSVKIREMLDMDGEISAIETDFIVEFRNEIIELYNQAKYIGLICL